jgi:hypothetical protein
MSLKEKSHFKLVTYLEGTDFVQNFIKSTSKLSETFWSEVVPDFNFSIKL